MLSPKGQEAAGPPEGQQEEFFLDLENITTGDLFGEEEAETPAPKEQETPTEAETKPKPATKPAKVEEEVPETPTAETDDELEGDEPANEGDEATEEGETPTEENLFIDLAKRAGIEIPEEGFTYADNEEGMLEFMNDYADAYNQRYIDELLGETYPEAGEFLQHLMNGGDPGEFMKANHPINDYATLEIKDEDLNKPTQRKVVRDFYLAQGIKSERIDAMINSLEAGGSLFATAEVAKEALTNAQELRKQQFADEQKAQVEQKRQQAAAFITSVDKVLEKADVEGIVIPRTQKAKLRTYMLQPVQGGFTQRDLAAANLSVEKQVLLSFLLMNDMSLEGLVKAKAKNEQALSIRKRLNKEQATTKGARTVSKEKESNPKKFHVDNFADVEFGSDGLEEATP